MAQRRKPGVAVRPGEALPTAPLGARLGNVRERFGNRLRRFSVRVDTARTPIEYPGHRETAQLLFGVHMASRAAYQIFVFVWFFAAAKNGLYGAILGSAFGLEMLFGAFTVRHVLRVTREDLEEVKLRAVTAGGSWVFSRRFGTTSIPNWFSCSALSWALVITPMMVLQIYLWCSVSGGCNMPANRSPCQRADSMTGDFNPDGWFPQGVWTRFDSSEAYAGLCPLYARWADTNGLSTLGWNQELRNVISPSTPCGQIDADAYLNPDRTTLDLTTNERRLNYPDPATGASVGVQELPGGDSNTQANTLRLCGSLGGVSPYDQLPVATPTCGLRNGRGRTICPDRGALALLRNAVLAGTVLDVNNRITEYAQCPSTTARDGEAVFAYLCPGLNDWARDAVITLDMLAANMVVVIVLWAYYPLWFIITALALHYGFDEPAVASYEKLLAHDRALQEENRTMRGLLRDMANGTYKALTEVGADKIS